MAIGVQNPSSLDVNSAVVAVPHGHFNVESFSVSSQDWVSTFAEVLCHQDYTESGKDIESCFLHADHATAARDISLMRLTFNSSADLKAPTTEASKIQNNDLTLEFIGSDPKSMLKFKLTDKKTGRSDDLEVFLKYWPSKLHFIS